MPEKLKKNKKSTPEQQGEQQAKKLLVGIPDKAGVYLFKDEDGEIIYIGKAKSLKKRVRTYFQAGKDVSPKVEVMSKKVCDIETILVKNEVEALILEDNLIKENQPRYNVVRRDDKNFLYVRISVQDDFPEVTLVRKMKTGGALYFGPYTSAESIRNTIQLAQKIFPYRACEGKIKVKAKDKVEVKGLNRKYPCLEYDIKRCLGPCIAKVSVEDYRKVIDGLVKFLKGDFVDVISQLKEKMTKVAAERNFELAAKYRDQIQAVKNIQAKQRVVSARMLDQDVVAVALGHKLAVVTLLQIRAGKLITRENFKYKIDERLADEAEVVTAFLRDYYPKAASLPEEVLLEFVPEDLGTVKNFLDEELKISFKFLKPERGEKANLIKLAKDNAKQYLENIQASWERDEERTKGASEKLAKLLGIKKLKRMECFDISHLQGTDTVASMAVFKNGKPVKADYRLFKIKELISGQVDDYKALREALKRRLRYLEKCKLPKGYTLRKLRKKELPEVLEICKKNKLSAGDFDYKKTLVIEKKGKLIAFCRYRVYESGEQELSSLWVTEKERGKRLGQLLIFELLRKLKGKVYGIVVDSKLLPYYEELGAQRIRILPAFVEKKWEDLKPAERKLLQKNAVPLLYLAGKQKEDKSFLEKPDLIVIDGGKGQLSTVEKILKGLDLKDICLIALAKREEEIFVSGKKDTLLLKKESNELHLLQRLRDEAHRFAIEFQRKLRGKRATGSVLDEIKGVGDTTRLKLLQHFASLEKIKEASLEELASVIGLEKARIVRQKMRG